MSLVKLAVVAGVAIGAAAVPAGVSTFQPKPFYNAQLGPRPFYLVENMDEGDLKWKLQSCANKRRFRTSSFVISHRGAPLQFPEHSLQGYEAAVRMGAGIIECDVSFTKDRELVCRHSNCDLHYTTNILSKPELAAKCTEPFVPADPVAGTPASAKCCTSDITLAEFQSLCAEMEGGAYTATNITADTPYFGRLGTTPDWRTNLYAYSCATPVSLKDHIAFVKSYDLGHTPEAKTPEIPMPFEGNYTQQDFIQQIVDTYKAANVPASRVWLQSFLQDDIFYWIDNEPEFAKQAIYLDERADLSADGFDEAVASLPALKERGVKIMGPSLWQLVTLDNKTIVPSRYATEAKRLGLEIITWSIERSGPLENGGGYYYQSISDVINNDGDLYTFLHVLAQDVGITKIFTDWAASIVYYANCFKLK